MGSNGGVIQETSCEGGVSPKAGLVASSREHGTALMSWEAVSIGEEGRVCLVAQDWPVHNQKGPLVTLNLVGAQPIKLDQL